MSNKIAIEELGVRYDDSVALRNVSMDIAENSVTALIGPSGCGKSTLIRCLNRMNDLVESCSVEGKVIIDGKDIYGEGTDLVGLRRNVGMVFQRPNAFPFSIFDNVAYGCRMAGIRKRGMLEAIVERAMRRAAIWDELKDRLDDPAADLSGGQQQRLCIARALAMEPEVLLMDEPCSALDPISTRKIEELVRELKEEFTVVIVTHNMEQARRVSDRTAFLYMGDLIEYADTSLLFDSPGEEETRRYVSGVFS